MKPSPPNTDHMDRKEHPLRVQRLFLLFTIIGLVIYFQSLGFPFVWDEYRLILNNAQEDYYSLKNLPQFFLHTYFYTPNDTAPAPEQFPYYRPVMITIHALCYNLFHLFYPAYHLLSLYLHICNALMIFLLFRQLLAYYLGFPVAEKISFMGSLIFLVHPRNVETVCIIANQTGLLSTFFTLISFLAWLKVLRKERPGIYFPLSLITLMLSMLTKESAYIVFVFHLTTGWLLYKERWRQWITYSAGYPAVLVAVLLMRHALISSPSIQSTLTKQLSRYTSFGDYVASILGLFFHQIANILLPLDTYSFQYPFSFTGRAEITLLLGTVFLLFCIWLWIRYPALRHAFLWVLLFYVPYSNITSIGEIAGGNLKTGSHHVYPAHAGIDITIAWACFSLSRSTVKSVKVLLFLLLSLWIGFLGVQSFAFASYFKSESAFYGNVLRKNKDYSGALINYAWHKTFVTPNYEEAERILQEGLDDYDRSGNWIMYKLRMMHNLISLQIRWGRFDEAYCYLDKMKQDFLEHAYGVILYCNLIDMLTDSIKRAQEKSAQAGPQEEMP